MRSRNRTRLAVLRVDLHQRILQLEEEQVAQLVVLLDRGQHLRVALENACAQPLPPDRQIEAEGEVPDVVAGRAPG